MPNNNDRTTASRTEDHVYIAAFMAKKLLREVVLERDSH
jgi:hypothetical protein